MDASTEVTDAIGAMGIDNGAKGKLPPSDSVEGHAEEHDVLADGAHSGESEVINPLEEVEMEATSQSQDIKPRVPEVRFSRSHIASSGDFNQWSADSHVFSGIFMCSRPFTEGCY